MNAKKQRIQYLDIAKGFGIILVVYGHLLRRQSIFETIKDYSIYIYSFHMALFFFISGICLFLKFNDSDKDFSIKKECISLTKKLFVPYVIWSIIYIFFSKSVGEAFITKVKYVYTFHGIAPVWFLGTLFFCELCFLLLYKLIKKHKFSLLCIILINIACTFGIAFIRYKLNLKIFEKSETIDFLSISAGRLFACNSMLFMGYWFAKLKILEKLKRVPSLIIGILCITALFFICYKTKNEIVLQFFNLGKYSFAKSSTLYFICSVLGSLGITLISYAIKSFRPLEYIGERSLGIMLLHYLPLPTMMYSVEFVSMFSTNIYLCLIISGIISIAICLFGIHLCRHKMYIFK